MDEIGIKELLEGLDEEELDHIYFALMDTAKRKQEQGMELDAMKKRLTAQKVQAIRRSREAILSARIMQRYEKGKTALVDGLV